jgi:hypothetical protein
MPSVPVSEYSEQHEEPRPEAGPAVRRDNQPAGGITLSAVFSGKKKNGI